MDLKYSKHLILSEFGEKNQNIIKNYKILIIGIGGIGCQVLTQLALNGFENIGICDYDIVSTSNLHRQFIYTINDATEKKLKIDCAEKYILERNLINIEKYNLKITNNNIKQVIENYEMIIDCTDNINTRYILNDACVIYNKIYVFSSAIQTSCQLSIFDNSLQNNNLPCLRCLFPNIDNETCENEGVLGTIPNLIGIITANEIIKFVCKLGDTLVGKLLTYNINSDFYNINIKNKNQNCLVCSENKIININNFHKLSIYEETCKIINNKNGISREKLKLLDNSFNLIYLDNKILIEEYFQKFYNIITTIDKLDNTQCSYLIFDCENKVRSKILVKKLKDKINRNNIYYNKIFYLE